MIPIDLVCHLFVCSASDNTVMVRSHLALEMLREDERCPMQILQWVQAGHRFAALTNRKLF